MSAEEAEQRQEENSSEKGETQKEAAVDINKDSLGIVNSLPVFATEGSLTKVPSQKEVPKEPSKEEISKEPSQKEISKEPSQKEISKEPSQKEVSKEQSNEEGNKDSSLNIVETLQEKKDDGEEKEKEESKENSLKIAESVQKPEKEEKPEKEVTKQVAKAEPPPEKKPKKEKPPEKEDYLQYVIEDNSTVRVPEDKIDTVLRYCTQEKKKAIEVEDYPRARSLTNAEETLKESKRSNLPSLAPKKVTFSPKSKLRPDPNQDREVRRSYKEDYSVEGQIEKMKQRIADFDHTTETLFKEKEKEHESELKEFESQYSDDTKFPRVEVKYRYPSSNVTYMKDLCRNLAYIGEFDAAEKEKAKLDKMVRKEKNMAQKKLINDYNEKKKRMLKRHEDELDALEKGRADEREILVQKKIQLQQLKKYNDSCLKPVKQYGSHSKLFVRSIPARPATEPLYKLPPLRKPKGE